MPYIRYRCAQTFSHHLHIHNSYAWLCIVKTPNLPARNYIQFNFMDFFSLGISFMVAIGWAVAGSITLFNSFLVLDRFVIDSIPFLGRGTRKRTGT